MAEWYVAKFKGGNAYRKILKTIIESLDLDIEIYDPQKPRKGKPDEKQYVIPGYFFLKTNPTYLPILKNAHGLQHFIGYPGPPTPVEEKDMNDVRNLESRLNEQIPIDTLIAGAEVTILEGPLKGNVGFLARDVELGKKAQLIMRNFQYGFKVEIDLTSLELI